MHTVADYIDRIIPTNGFISNPTYDSMSYYTGYRIFIRSDLENYETIDDWREDFGSIHEYVYQEYPRGVPGIIDASFRGVNLDEDMFKYLTDKNLILLDPKDMLLDTVNMHRINMKLCPITKDKEYNYLDFIDTSSNEAKYEKRLVSINEKKYNNR